MDTEGKQAAIAIINTLPDDISLDEVIYRLAFRAHVEEGLRDSVEGRTVPNEEIERKVAEWRRLAGL